MKANLYRNIELVQIILAPGEKEYYFPENVSWDGKTVQELVICAPQNDCVSPVDGITPVVTASTIGDLYVTLVNQNGEEILRDVHVSQLSHRNNNRVKVNDVLDLSICRIRLAEAPENSAVLLVYAVYESGETEDYEEPKKSVTVRFPLGAGKEIKFRELINLYIHALPHRVKGIIFEDAVNNPAILIMRDHELTYSISNLHCEMARSQMVNGATSAEDVQACGLRLDDLDIDFDYSRVYNPTDTDNTQVITFEY